MKGFLYKLLSGHVRQLVVPTGLAHVADGSSPRHSKEVGRKTGQTTWASPCHLLADWPARCFGFSQSQDIEHRRLGHTLDLGQRSGNALVVLRWIEDQAAQR